MPLDRARLGEILGADHSYCGPEPEYRNDDRLNPSAREFIAAQFRADMRVLDVGSGDGATLLENSDRFSAGIGIENDERHLALGEQAKRERGVRNVEFMLLDLGDVPTSFPRESFDFAFSERGPVGYDSRSVQAVLSALRPDGLLFCELIGDLHHQEMRELFSSAPRMSQAISALDQVRVAMERNGVGIRIAADLISKRYYPTPRSTTGWSFSARSGPGAARRSRPLMIPASNSSSNGTRLPPVPLKPRTMSSGWEG